MHTLIRSAALNGFVEVSNGLGLDALAVIAAVGIDARYLHDDDLLIPADKFYALLELTATVAGVEDVGLRVVQTRRLSNLGVIGLLVREEPTVREALKVLATHIHLQNDGLSVCIEETDSIARIVIELIGTKESQTRQSTELAVGVVHKVLSEFLGAAWQPIRICFTHSAPSDSNMHQKVFGPRIDFENAFNGLVCRTSDLDAQIRGSDPGMARYLRRHLTTPLAPPRANVAARVRQLAWLLLPGGHCTIEEVAKRLSVNRRTIHRRLAKDGLTFPSIVHSVRIEVAKRYIAGGHKPIYEVADLVGFSSVSGFCRWFRREYGVSALAYRAEQRKKRGREDRAMHSSFQSPYSLNTNHDDRPALP